MYVLVHFGVCVSWQLASLEFEIIVQTKTIVCRYFCAVLIYNKQRDTNKSGNLKVKRISLNSYTVWSASVATKTPNQILLLPMLLEVCVLAVAKCLLCVLKSNIQEVAIRTCSECVFKGPINRTNIFRLRAKTCSYLQIPSN